VYYTHSEDGGLNWLGPLDMAHRLELDLWTSRPEITLVGEQEIHLTWVCGELAHRCHRWSVDGGNNWTETSRVFGNMLALAGNDTLFVDRDGTLFWVLQLRYPSAIYYSTWEGTRWSDLAVVNDRNLHDGHHVRAVIARGSQVHLAVVDQHQKEIWYIRGDTTAQEGPPDPTPTVQAEVLVTGTPATTPIPTPTRTPPPALSDAALPEMSSTTQSAFLIESALPVLGLLVLAFAVKRFLSNGR
jgi:hypothetical protein